jgi:tetratricopeptide (TPR) repeat protein
MSEVSDRIESLIDADDWKGARKVIRAALLTEPESHWLLSRLALTYYEEFKYEESLEYETRALALAPNCPLALWGYAGALEMLGREREALEVYRRLVRRGAESIAYGECGEGLARARGLVADSLYRMAGCYKSLGQSRKAAEHLEKHLAQRGKGCHSIYRLREARKGLDELRPKTPSANGAI